MDTFGSLTDTHMPLTTMAVRLVAAIVFGALIGLEREWRRRPAGLRTHMLVALAACLFTILTGEMLHAPGFEASVGGGSDPIRIIEAVTAGVAFLSAGAIIQGRGGVQGITTGAGMWLAGALGVAAGIGQFAVGAMAAAIGLLVLAVLGLVQIPEADKRQARTGTKTSDKTTPAHDEDFMRAP